LNWQGGGNRQKARRLARRTALKIGVGAVALPAGAHPYRGVAGKLSFFSASHFVPGADEALKMLVEQWAERNSTTVQADFVGAQTKDPLPAEEAQANIGITKRLTGHSALRFEGGRSRCWT
jgi:hypothetical protein